MLCIKKIATPTLAALLMVSLPAFSALAADAVTTSAKEPAQEQAKSQPKTSPTDVLQRVNGTAITRREIDRAVKVLLDQNHVQPPVTPKIMQEAEAAALEELTAAELLYQEAASLEIKDLDKQVAEKVAQAKARIGTDAEVEKALKSVDMTQKDMEDFTRKDILIGTLLEKKFTEKATVTDAETRKFYNDNLDKYFKKPESARASHILIGVDEKASADDRKKAKEKAEAILKRIKKGEDFAAIAKTDSTCPSAAQGGDLGTFSRGQTKQNPFETAAFALKPGEISDVVETKLGYHIIKLTEKHEETTEKYEDVKPQIEEFLKKEKVQKAIADHIAELKKKAKIEKL